MIWKGKKYSKDSMKIILNSIELQLHIGWFQFFINWIHSKFVRFVRFDFIDTLKVSNCLEPLNQVIMIPYIRGGMFSVTNVLKWLCFFSCRIQSCYYNSSCLFRWRSHGEAEGLEGLNSEINNGNQAFQSLFDCLMKNEDMAPGSGLIIIN